MTKVKIVGAGGYGGVGAIEIFSRHPEVELTSLVDIMDTGKRISELYPHLEGICDLPLVTADDDGATGDVVFFATPDRVGMRLAPDYVNDGYKVIDYSGDFRFNEPATYAEYASRINIDTDHLATGLLPMSAYGITELHRDEVAAATVVGNPGCFAVSATLAAAPAVAADLIDPDSLIFDAKTGVSGAGKKPSPVFHFPHRYEEMNAYKMGGHQHVMEIEHELGMIAGSDISVTFNTQVVPVVRGIMTSMYARPRKDIGYETLLDAYRAFYDGEPFMSVIDESGSAGNRHIRGTNRCVLWVNLDRRTNTVVVMSHIDNLLKGQAGSAVQNMNVMFGLEETLGLVTPGMYP